MNPVDTTPASADPSREGFEEVPTLHQIARVLQDEDRPAPALISEVLRLVPSGWLYPEAVGVRIHFRDADYATPDFRRTEWMQSAAFTIPGGGAGGIDVCYLEERPPAQEGPFLSRERHLLDALADLLRSFFRHVTAGEALEQARSDLEATVAEHRRAQAKIEEYQRQLRKVASELSLSEARQRRVIAQDLHDQIGQALAFIRMRVIRFQGDTVFCGFEDSIEEILRLLAQTINSTRSLTFEISPPVLYELGLGSALEWLAERLGESHGIPIEVEADEAVDALPDDTRVVLFQAVRELLVNAIKHADPGRVTVQAGVREGEVAVVVSDDGRGFDVGRVREAGVDGMTFGLFSIRERLAYLGGSMVVESNPGQGTSVTLTTPMGNPTREAGP